MIAADRFAIQPPPRLPSLLRLFFIKENVYNGDLGPRSIGHTNSRAARLSISFSHTKQMQMRCTRADEEGRADHANRALKGIGLRAVPGAQRSASPACVRNRS